MTKNPNPNQMKCVCTCVCVFTHRNKVWPGYLPWEVERKRGRLSFFSPYDERKKQEEDRRRRSRRRECCAFFLCTFLCFSVFYNADEQLLQ